MNMIRGPFKHMTAGHFTLLGLRAQKPGNPQSLVVTRVLGFQESEYVLYIRFTVCVYIYINIYIYIHKYKYKYIYIYFSYMYIYIYRYICMYIHKYKYKYIYIFLLHVYIYIDTYVCIYIYVDTDTHTHSINRQIT